MVLAQNLGEYGAMAAFTSAFSRTWTAVQSTLSDTTPTTWLVVGIVAAVLLMLRQRS
jgi:hypothetical protein